MCGKNWRMSTRSFKKSRRGLTRHRALGRFDEGSGASGASGVAGGKDAADDVVEKDDSDSCVMLSRDTNPPNEDPAPPAKKARKARVEKDVAPPAPTDSAERELNQWEIDSSEMEMETQLMASD